MIKENCIREIPEMELMTLIRSAGALICEVRGDGTDKQTVSKEGYANYVTAYDVRVQTFLEDGIRKLMPSASFLAEENGEDGNPVGAGWTFVIDPIDGTTNFIRDYGCSVISVALLSDGIPVWGAVYQPYTQEMFWAGRGCGAFLNGRAIHVSHRGLRDALVVFGTSPYYRERLGRKTMELASDILMQTADLRRSGAAALDLCYVACGRADAFYELSLSPWDFAAGALIIQEAGGWISDIFGEALPVQRKSSVAAGGPMLQESFLQLFADCEL